MGAPRVSVLLPVFDSGPWLATCLRSLARQSLADWECVLVDDGSRDDSLAIARQHAAKDPRIRVFARPHAGLIASLNAGIEHCRAPLVARMDGDDWMHRDRLALQAAVFEGDSGLALLGAHVRLFPRSRLDAPHERALPGEAGRQRTGRFAYEGWLNAMRSVDDIERNLFVECPVAHPSWMIRRDVLERHRYEEVDWPEDYDLVLRLHAHGERIGVLPKRLLAWRDAEDRLSRRSGRYDIDAFTRCKAAHLARSFLAASKRYALWGYGGTGRALAKRLAAHDRHPACIVDVHPRRIGQTIRDAPVIAPETLAKREKQRLIVSVAGEGPRNEIRGFLAKLDYREGRDFVCAA